MQTKKRPELQCSSGLLASDNAPAVSDQHSRPSTPRLSHPSRSCRNQHNDTSSVVTECRPAFRHSFPKLCRTKTAARRDIRTATQPCCLTAMQPCYLTGRPGKTAHPTVPYRDIQTEDHVLSHAISPVNENCRHCLRTQPERHKKTVSSGVEKTARRARLSKIFPYIQRSPYSMLVMTSRLSAGRSILTSLDRSTRTSSADGSIV